MTPSTAKKRSPAAPPPRSLLAAVHRPRAVGFLSVVASVVALLVVFGLVVSNAMIVQNQQELDRLDARIADLEGSNQGRHLEVAELEAPDRIIGAATALGMIEPDPDAVVILPPLTDAEIRAARP